MAASRSATMPPVADHHSGYGGEGAQGGVEYRFADREDQPGARLLALRWGRSQIVDDGERKHRHDDDQKRAEHPPPCTQPETDEEGESKRDDKPDPRGDFLYAPVGIPQPWLEQT